MKKVLLLGAGMVAKPLVDYFLKQGILLTIATRTIQKAEKLIRGRENGKAVSWIVEDIEMLEQLISKHDLVVSLLPYAYHVTVAKLCIKFKKDMATTSYASPEMKQLNNEAKFLKNKEIIEIPTESLFKNPLQVSFPETGIMKVYPNRDSLSYIDVYHLKGIETMYRGTFRYPHWCESMDAIKALNMVRYEVLPLKGKTYAEVTAGQIGETPENLKQKVADKLNILQPKKILR